jgi:hypothetical protein
VSEDLRARLQTLAERNEEPLPGMKVFSDEEAKERYLDLLEEGEMPETAAIKVGRTATWFRRRMNPEGANYDEYFTEAYEQITRPDGLHRLAVRGRARAALMKAVEAGDMRAVKVALQAFDPDFSFLRPQAAIGDVNVDKLLVLMDGVPTPILQQVRDALAQQQKALPDVEQ